MGKKSKRRGGTSSGGGKKGTTASSGAARGGAAAARSSVLARDQPGRGARGSSNTDTPIDALALLEGFTPPRSLKGIISTNDDPDACAFCSGPLTLGRRYVVAQCCGKRGCDACFDEGRVGYARDLLGIDRCTFCNSLKWKEAAILRREAMAGNAWAQHFYGTSLDESEKLEEAASWYQRAASHGHPEAFLALAGMYRCGMGCPLDLKLARLYAEKARSLHPGLGVLCNRILLSVAVNFSKDGLEKEADAILCDLVHQDNDALDGDLCERTAASLYTMGLYRLSGEMRLKAFCLGYLGSSFSAAECYFVAGNYPHCKLWLSVACQTKGWFFKEEFQPHGKMFWVSRESRRDEFRSKLREIRNSCGGCGAALEGKMRKYCRGCKAYCYCSRECQKLHWNCKKDSHRDECKETKEHWEKAVEAIRSGKVILLKEE